MAATPPSSTMQATFNPTPGAETSSDAQTLRQRRPRSASRKMGEADASAVRAGSREGGSSPASLRVRVGRAPSECSVTPVFDCLTSSWVSLSPSAEQAPRQTTSPLQTPGSSPTRVVDSLVPARLPQGAIRGAAAGGTRPPALRAQGRFELGSLHDIVTTGVFGGALGLACGFLPAMVNGAIAAAFHHGFSAFCLLPAAEGMPIAEGWPGATYTAQAWPAAHVGMRATVGAYGLLVPLYALFHDALRREEDQRRVNRCLEDWILTQMLVAPAFATVGLLSGAVVGHSINFVVHGDADTVVTGFQRFGIAAGLIMAIDVGLGHGLLSAPPRPHAQPRATQARHPTDRATLA